MKNITTNFPKKFIIFPQRLMRFIHSLFDRQPYGSNNRSISAGGFPAAVVGRARGACLFNRAGHLRRSCFRRRIRRLPNTLRRPRSAAGRPTEQQNRQEKVFLRTSTKNRRSPFTFRLLFVSSNSPWPDSISISRSASACAPTATSSRAPTCAAWTTC